MKNEQIKIAEKSTRIDKCEGKVMADLLNQEMEELTKSKEIEQMALTIYNTLYNMRYSIEADNINLRELAKELLKYYQPKLPKDSVVLSKEEYLKDFSSQFNKGYKHGSKETAREIANEIKMAFYTQFDELIPSIMADKIDEIAKEYGVEVE